MTVVHVLKIGLDSYPDFIQILPTFQMLILQIELVSGVMLAITERFVSLGIGNPCRSVLLGGGSRNCLGLG